MTDIHRIRHFSRTQAARYCRVPLQTIDDAIASGALRISGTKIAEDDLRVWAPDASDEVLTGDLLPISRAFEPGGNGTCPVCRSICISWSARPHGLGLIITCDSDHVSELMLGDGKPAGLPCMWILRVVKGVQR